MNILHWKDGNWGLKLLALILALVIYHTLKTKTEIGQKNNDGSIFQTH